MPGRSWLKMIAGDVACAVLELLVWLCIIGTVLLLGAVVASAQTSDSRGEVQIKQPEYQGERAWTLRDGKRHVKNEGGSNGAGLCVIASITANGIDQGVPGLDAVGSDGHAGHGSKLWQTAKSRWGGYSPGKLKGLVEEVMPGEKWASYYGEDPAILDKLSREGYPIGVTMSTGATYNYRPIHHMVSLAHYRAGGWACVVDNNRPGVWSWMPAKEFLRRWYDGGVGWAWVWTRKRTSAIAIGASLPLLLTAVLFVLGTRRRALA
jgi:hypothetical protein